MIVQGVLWRWLHTGPYGFDERHDEVLNVPRGDLPLSPPIVDPVDQTTLEHPGRLEEVRRGKLVDWSLWV